MNAKLQAEEAMLFASWNAYCETEEWKQAEAYSNGRKDFIEFLLGELEKETPEEKRDWLKTFTTLSYAAGWKAGRKRLREQRKNKTA